MKIYCQECGQATLYEVKKPLGCCHCLTPFGGVTAKQKVIIKRPEVSTIEYEEEIQDEFNIPVIDASDILIDNKNIFTFGNIAGTAKVDNSNNIRPKGYGKKDLNKLRERIRTKSTQEI